VAKASNWATHNGFAMKRVPPITKDLQPAVAVNGRQFKRREDGVTVFHAPPPPPPRCKSLFRHRPAYATASASTRATTTRSPVQRDPWPGAAVGKSRVQSACIWSISMAPERAAGQCAIIGASPTLWPSRCSWAGGRAHGERAEALLSCGLDRVILHRGRSRSPSLVPHLRPSTSGRIVWESTQRRQRWPPAAGLEESTIEATAWPPASGSNVWPRSSAATSHRWHLAGPNLEALRRWAVRPVSSR